MPAISCSWILADADAVVGILFFLLAFVGWVVNFFNQKKPPVPPNRKNNPQRPAQDPKTVQSEIEKFLNQARQPTSEPPQGQRSASGQSEVRQQPPAQSTRRAPPAERRSRSRKDVWDEQVGNTSSQPAPVRQQPQPQRKPSPNQQPRRAPAPSGRGAEAGKSPLARPSQESRFPQSIRPEGESRLGIRDGQDPTRQISSQVSAHLGTFTATSPQSIGEQARSETLSTRETPATRLAKMMKSRGSVRNAILLSEIMSKPRALRR